MLLTYVQWAVFRASLDSFWIFLNAALCLSFPPFALLYTLRFFLSILFMSGVIHGRLNRVLEGFEGISSFQVFMCVHNSSQFSWTLRAPQVLRKSVRK